MPTAFISTKQTKKKVKKCKWKDLEQKDLQKKKVFMLSITAT